MATILSNITSATRERDDPIVCRVLFVVVTLVCIQVIGINLAKASENNTPWYQLSEKDKSTFRERWTKERIGKVLSALKVPGANLPETSVPNEKLARDINVLARAHSVYGFSEPLDWYIRQDPLPRYTDLRGIPLKGCKLEGVNLAYTYLEGADLSNCDLSNTNLTGANLNGANLTEATLNKATLDRALLIKADLSKAQLKETSLRYALLDESTIVKANLMDADLEGAQFADFGVVNALKVLGSYIGSNVGDTPLISSANLSQSNLLGANFRGAILANAKLEGASLYGAVFENTLIDVRELDKAFNYRYIVPGKSSAKINIPPDAMQFVEAFHREAKRFFASNGMKEMEAEYRFWEQEAITDNPKTPLHVKIIRIVFVKWPYGYGSRPMWLFYYALSIVLIFAALYFLLTISGKKSGVYRVHIDNGQEVIIPLSWGKGLMLINCAYFSLLSLATFGYGVFKPSQWIEFFRLEPIQLVPIGWARILVGLQAAIGIYLAALLTINLFGKA